MYDLASPSNPPNNCSTVTDQASTKRRACTDALGRLAQVYEDPNNLNYETDYKYDVLNNLTCVEQHGGVTGTGCSANPANDYLSAWRVRRFNYNSLSQLLSSTNPEFADSTTGATAGQFCTVSYAYDNVGNLYQKTSPKPGQGTCTATVLATSSYEADNRLTQKSFNDGTTPTVKYGYDGATLAGCTNAPPMLTDSNPAGRRTAMCDGSGATSWSHDLMGDVLSEKRLIPGPGSKSISYTYNLDESLATLVYPGTGKTITYSYNGAGRPLNVKNIGAGINYATTATYAPPGELATLTVGASIHMQNSYTNRLQPLQMVATTGSALTSTQLASTTCPVTVGTILHFVYGFGSGTNDNGNVLNIANCRDANRSQNFTYDSLNRIQTAYTSGPNWGESYGSATSPGGVPTTPGIDAWGNLWQRSQITGKTSYEPLSVSATVQNRLTGYGYDAAGNITSNGAATYTYDAENRLKSTAGWNYTYDGDGKRIKKCTSSCTSGTLYWTGVGSNTLGESDLTGNIQKEYLYFGGVRMARRDVSGDTTHYYFASNLGSASVVTNATGSTPFDQDIDYYPYGGEIDIVNSVTQNYKFTGKERDAESGLDNFGARFDASSLGRFMSADPITMKVDRALVPQRLNLYAYVSNNPLAYADPSGKDLVAGTGDQKAIKAALVDIASRPGGREFLQKFDNLTAQIKLSTGSVKDPEGNDRPAGIKGNFKLVKDESGRVDVTGNLELKVDTELSKGARANGMEDAPKSDAEAIGHELEHFEQEILKLPESESGATKSIDSVLDQKTDKTLQKEAGQFVDEILKSKTDSKTNKRVKCGQQTDNPSGQTAPLTSTQNCDN